MQSMLPENVQFWHVIAGAAGALAIYFTYKIGVFRRVTVEEGEFHGALYIYKNIQCNIKDVGEQIAAINRDRENYVAKQPKKLHHPVAAIYYDDPQDLVDPATCRITLGIMMRADDGTCKAHFETQGYTTKFLPKVKAIKSQFPIRFWTSGIQWMVASMKVYPSLFGYIDAHKARLEAALKKEGV